MKKVYTLIVVLLVSWTTLWAQMPVIVVDQTNFNEDIEYGQTLTVEVPISNIGNRDLEWNVTNFKVTFTKPSYADWTLPENQDRINNKVWITRAHSEGLFNIADETGFGSWGSGAPSGTLWAAGPTNGTLTTYKTFMQMCQEVTAQGPFGYSCFMPIFTTEWFKENFGVLSMRTVESGKYYDIDMLSWTTGNEEGGGGFSYLRADAFPWIKPQQTNGKIVPGSTFNLEIELDATELLGGTYEGTLVIASNDANTPEIPLYFTINVLGISQISTNTSIVDFGNQPLGFTKTLNLFINNLGTGELQISNIQTSSSAFSAPTSAITILPQKMYVLPISFSPENQEPYDEQLTFDTNDPNALNVSIQLTGSGVGAPTIVMATEPINVSIVAGTSQEETITIENTGVSSLHWNLKPVPQSNEPVTFTKNDYANWNLPGNYDVITPNVVITRESERGIFNIAKESSYNTDNYSSPQGTIWANGNSSDFYDLDLYDTWHNAVNGYPPGMINDQLSMYSLLDEYTIDIMFTQWTSNANGGGFSYIRDATLNFVSTENWSGIVEPSESFDLEITFDATWLIEGQYSGFLNFSTNDPSNTTIIVPVSLTVAGVPQISVNENEFLFQGYVGFSESKKLFITNAGSTNLEISSFVIDDPQFTIEPVSASYNGILGLGSQEAFYIIYTPTSVGNVAATLTIASNDPSNPTVVIDLLGECSEPPVIIASANPIEQTLASGDQITFDIEIENAGAATLTGQLMSRIGNKVYFNKPSYANWLLPEFQDRISDFVWITRQNNRGIFNIKYENYYNWSSYESPIGTLWYNTPTIESENGDYLTWRSAVFPPSSIAGTTISMVSVEEDRYFDFMFESWASNDSGGGFSYYRVETPKWLKSYDRTFSVDADGSILKTITLETAGLSVGVYNANLVIESNDPAMPEILIPISLTITGFPEIDTDLSVAFDETPVGITSTKTLRVYNTGADVLLVSEIENSSTVFSIPTGGFSVNPGQFVELTLSFTPESDELYQEDIVIVSNDPNTPEYTVSLQGQGVQPPSILVSTTLIEATLNVNSIETVPITIENSGSSDLHWSISGNEVTYTKASGVDWNLPVNQDRITSNVWITRKSSQAIFNIAKESGYGAGSPLDTKWAFGSTSSLSPSSYTNWITAVNADPQTMIGQPMSMYLVTDNKYFDILFHSYAGGGTGGGFSYTRKEVLPSWLSFSETSGVVAAGSDVTIDAIINTAGLNGNYSTKFGIFSNDPNNLQIGVDVNLTVGAIFVANPIANIRVDQGFGTYDVDISNVFTSFDPDPLEILPISSNLNVASVTLNGDILTITEVGAIGNSIITLRAEDDNGNVLFHDFTFIVNAPPIVANPIANIIRNVGFGTQTINLIGTFTDINNDELMYQVESSNEQVVTASVLGSQITINEVGLGTSTITVSASDGFSPNLATTSFTFRVNAIPSVVSSLTDVVVDEGFGLWQIDVANVFSDDDSDELTFTAESSNQSVVTVALVGTQLNVSEIGNGSASITITASDGVGGLGANQFNFTVTPLVDISVVEGIKFTVYPNPATNFVNIETSKLVGEKLYVEIIAIDGQVVHKQSLRNVDFTVKLNLSGLKSGAYIIRLSDGRNTVVARPLIKM